MNKHIAILSTLALAATVFGCAAPEAPIGSDEPVPLPTGGQMRALEHQAAGEYRSALRYWRQAEKIAAAKVERLAATLAAIAREHAERGAAFYADHEGEKALAEFLQALRHDPDNALALDYLSHRYTARQSVAYSVEEGDTFASIAAAVYGDRDYTFAVSHFAGVERQEDLRPGSVLELPRLDSFSSPQLKQYRADILTARKLFQERRYESLLPLVENILARHPGDEEASYLRNSSLVGLGEELRRREEYEEAAAVYSRVDPAFRNVEAAIREIRAQQLEKLAGESRRRNGFFLRRGRELLAQGQYQLALQVLGGVDPGFEGLHEALAETREAMRRQAEIHYRRGVKLYLEDNLSAAVAEWRRTLSYDPDHGKAADYIDKALNVIKKVKELE